MPKKYFTVDEANTLLPEVDNELTVLQQIKNKFEQQYTKRELLKKVIYNHPQSVDKDSLFALECEIEFLQMEAQTHMKNFQRLGVEIKDIEMGLIDFPAIMNGEEVLLCWKQGEERVGHYHGLQDGFACRKKLED